MFPEITRDEVFRLETRRLWLRWPTISDRAEIAALAAQKHWDDRAGDALSVVSDEAALRAILRWRMDAEQGDALHLVLVPKSGTWRPIGVVHLVQGRNGEPELDYCLDTEARGHGLMTEAAQAVIDAGFLVGGLRRVSASPRVVNTAGRRVLERCGFTFVGTGLGRAGTMPGLAACDLFSLDRTTWRSLKGWTLPDFDVSGSADPFPSLRIGPAESRNTRSRE